MECASADQLDDDDTRVYQACKACKGNARIVNYRPLEKKTGPVTQRRHRSELCAKCNSGNICAQLRCKY